MPKRLCILIALTLFGPIAVDAQRKRTDLDHEGHQARALPAELATAIATGEFTDVNPAAFLARVARECNRPIGFEVADTVAADRHISITGIPETIDDVLDMFVRADPRYTWGEHGGVINVAPLGARVALLDTRVSRFRVSASWGEEVVDALIGTAEARQAAARFGVAPRIPIVTFGSGQRPEREQVLLELEDVRMSEILDAAVIKLGGTFWVFQIYGDQGQYYTLVIW